MTWIRCTPETMPAAFRWVLCSFLHKETHFTLIGKYMPSNGSWKVLHSDSNYGSPTHWMPLPDPPRDDDQPTDMVKLEALIEDTKARMNRLPDPPGEGTT